MESDAAGSSARRPEYRGCFACGQDNPIGLKLTFACQDGAAHAVFVPSPEHQGYPGRLHGGLICTLLDEAMAYAMKTSGQEGYTARLEVRFHRAVRLKEPVTVEAHVVRTRGRLVELEARLLDTSGTALATAAGKYITAPVSQPGKAL